MPKGYPNEYKDCERCGATRILKAEYPNHRRWHCTGSKPHPLANTEADKPKIGRPPKSRAGWTITLVNGSKQIAATVPDSTVKKIAALLIGV